MDAELLLSLAAKVTNERRSYAALQAIVGGLVMPGKLKGAELEDFIRDAAISH